MSARRLTAGKDHADDLLFGSGGVAALLEGDLRFAVGVREQSSDLVLVRDTGSCRAFFDADFRDTVSEHPRKLRLILVPCFLKR